MAKFNLDVRRHPDIKSAVIVVFVFANRKNSNRNVVMSVRNSVSGLRVHEEFIERFSSPRGRHWKSSSGFEVQVEHIERF